MHQQVLTKAHQQSLCGREMTDSAARLHFLHVYLLLRWLIMATKNVMRRGSLGTWEKLTDNFGRAYYVNHTTRQVNIC